MVVSSRHNIGQCITLFDVLFCVAIFDVLVRIRDKNGLVVYIVLVISHCRGKKHEEQTNCKKCKGKGD